MTNYDDAFGDFPAEDYGDPVGEEAEGKPIDNYRVMYHAHKFHAQRFVAAEVTVFGGEAEVHVGVWTTISTHPSLAKAIGKCRELALEDETANRSIPWTGEDDG